MFTGSPSSASSSSLLTEGWHALRTTIFIRHLQHVLDALRLGSQVPPTECECSVHTSGERQGTMSKNHIDTRVAWDKPRRRGRTSARRVSGRRLVVGNDNVSDILTPGNDGMIERRCVRYILLNPFLGSSQKSPSPTLQSTLHELFLPTPFKYLSFEPDDPQKRALEEVLKPGALYAE